MHLAELIWLCLVELGLVVELGLLVELIGLDLSELGGLRLGELVLVELGLLRLLVDVKRLLRLLHLWLGLLHRLLLAHE